MNITCGGQEELRLLEDNKHNILCGGKENSSSKFHICERLRGSAAWHRGPRKKGLVWREDATRNTNNRRESKGT
jgi:hypothetical protein